MDSLLLQDWISVADNGPTSPGIAQGAPGYIDVSEYQDLVFYLHVPSPITSGPLPQIEYQTSPSADDASFLPMVVVPSTFLGGGVLVTTVLGKYASVPPAKYVRWFCSNGTNGGYQAQCTFRIWMSGVRMP
jgi:hypothetical protein